MKSQIFNKIRYYEIAFSFINPRKQRIFFERLAKKFGKTRLGTILEIGCGTGLTLKELAKKYKVIGLDDSDRISEYLKFEAKQEGVKIETFKADLNRFKLDKKVDFAYIIMGSIVYTKKKDLFYSHLESVADCLKPGGLYAIECLDIDWADPSFWKAQSWLSKQGKTKVKTTFQLVQKDFMFQTVVQTIKLEVEEDGEKKEFMDKEEIKIVIPDEFKLLVERTGRFEFLGFIEREKAKPGTKIFSNNVALLRRI